MASTEERSNRAVCFVDALGGALSVLAAGVAAALEISAAAATVTEPTPLPEEIAIVLTEVGMRLPDAPVAVPFASIDRTAKDVVFLGAEPPPELAAGTALDVALFEGPGELERLATARIARDRIERHLEATRSSS